MEGVQIQQPDIGRTREVGGWKPGGGLRRLWLASSATAGSVSLSRGEGQQRSTATRNGYPGAGSSAHATR